MLGCDQSHQDAPTRARTITVSYGGRVVQPAHRSQRSCACPHDGGGRERWQVEAGIGWSALSAEEQHMGEKKWQNTSHVDFGQPAVDSHETLVQGCSSLDPAIEACGGDGPDTSGRGDQGDQGDTGGPFSRKLDVTTTAGGKDSIKNQPFGDLRSTAPPADWATGSTRALTQEGLAKSVESDEGARVVVVVVVASNGFVQYASDHKVIVRLEAAAGPGLWALGDFRVPSDNAEAWAA
ncbi:hypothetical protein VDGL01_02508 [Verticillium dahliae]